MSFTLEVPAETTSINLEVLGTKEADDIIHVFLNDIYIQSIDSQVTNFSVIVFLSEGNNSLMVKNGEKTIYKTIVLRALEPQLEVLGNRLDDHGVISNLDRHENEDNEEFIKWIGYANNEYIRGSTKTGLTNAALVSSRIEKSDFLKITSKAPFLVVVKSASVEIKSDFFMKTLSLTKGSYQLIDNCRIDEVLSCDGKYHYDQHGYLILKEDCEVSFRYTAIYRKWHPINELVDMVGPIQIQIVHDLPTMGLIPGVYVSTWDGIQHSVTIQGAKQWLIFPSETFAQEYLLEGTRPGTPGTKMEDSRSTINDLMPYLFDTTSSSNMIFADDLGVDRAASLPAHFDCKLPGTPQSGGYLQPELVPGENNLNLRLSPGYFFLGSEMYYLFANKKCINMMESCKITFDFSEVIFRNGNGELIIPMEVGSLNGPNDIILNDFMIKDVFIDGVEVSRSVVYQLHYQLVFDLARLFLENKKLALSVDVDNTLVKMKFVHRTTGATFNRGLMTFQGRKHFEIDSKLHAPVILTDERDNITPGVFEVIR